jgi:AcrR family transcriptional regulator
MGIVERRERLKKQVRNDILKTARDIAREEGWQGVSIRKIADLIEYSPPIIYEYFNSKDKLLETIRINGFNELRGEFERIKEIYRDPEKQLVEVAQSIWNFSVGQPEVFQVMFNQEGAFVQSKKAYLQEMDLTGNPVWEMIARLRPKAGEKVSMTYYEWWCLTYGFISITMTTQAKQDIPKLESLYVEGVRRFIRSIM